MKQVLFERQHQARWNAFAETLARLEKGKAAHRLDDFAADYRRLLGEAKVRPGTLDLWIMRADGSEKRQVTELGGASFAPFFTVDGAGLIFSSNWENPTGRNFDLYLVTTSGAAVTPVTRDPAFDGFPMFSPDGRRLVFASNRGARARGETNLFVAEWRE